MTVFTFAYLCTNSTRGQPQLLSALYTTICKTCINYLFLQVQCEAEEGGHGHQIYLVICTREMFMLVTFHGPLFYSLRKSLSPDVILGGSILQKKMVVFHLFQVKH